MAITLTQTGVGRSTAARVDNYANPFNVGVHLTVTGTVTYNIDVSPEGDMVTSPTIWTPAVGFMGLAGGQAASLTIPCYSVSINVTAGTGTVTAYLTQSGER